MGSLVGIALGAWLAWQFGLWLSFLLFSGSLFWLGPALTFLLGFVTGKAMVTALMGRFSLNGGGLWSSAFGRRIIGMTADGLLQLISIYIGYLVCNALGAWEWIGRFFEPTEWWEQAWLFAVAVTVISSTINLAMPQIKVAIGKGSRPLRRLWRSLFVGVGGSSRFAGLLEEWANPWKPGTVLLGNSLYDPAWKVGKVDDRHFINVATSRSGKNRSSVIPNLLTWPGSALVLDPKGENAAVTALRRARLGQTVRIVDPFDVLKERSLHDSPAHWTGSPYPVFRFNPLAEVDLTSKTVVEQIGVITDGTIIASSQTNPFFDEKSREIIDGVIAHVLTSPKVKDEDRHLGTVRDYLVERNGRDLTEMTGNMEAGGLAAAAATSIKTGSAGGSGDVLLTAQLHTKWLDSLAMRDALSKSDFSMKDFKNNNMTIYLVLPGNVIDLHARFMRMFVNLMLREAARGPRPKYSALFVLDEFYALGSFPLLSTAAGLMAGYGVKLFPILQNLTQLRDRYPDTWETFLGNAGMWQVFAVNDQMTARYMSERLGNHIAWRRVNRGGAVEWEPMGSTWLRTSVELARESSRESGNQLIFDEGGDTFLLRRSPYDQSFKPSEYSPNPYEAEPPKWRRWWRAAWTDDKETTGAMADAAVSNVMDRSGLTGWLERWDERARAKRMAKEAARTPPASPMADRVSEEADVPPGILQARIDELDRRISSLKAKQISDLDAKGLTEAERRKEIEFIEQHATDFRAKQIALGVPALDDFAPVPKPSATIDWGRMGQSSQRVAGNGAAAEGQGKPPPLKPVQADTPRQTNGDGIDWQSLEAAWGIEPAPEQVKPQSRTADDGLRPPPPLKPARRRKGQAGI